MELKAFLFSLIVIYISARLLGEFAVRIGQSSVLGELLAGVLVGPSVLGLVHQTETLTLLGEIGVMLLLFEVGLESDLQSFLRVGPSAAFVALIGVVLPFGLGYGVAAMLHFTPLQAIFIGATLTATSVAISARVLSDLGRLQSREGNIILGAAVLDDILGLVILSVIVGLAESGTVSWLTIAQTAGFAILFLGPLLWAAYFLRHRLSIHPAGFALFAAALLMHDLGAFGAYQKVFFGVQFDTVVHFFFGFVVAVLLARALRFGFTLSGWQLWIATILVMLGLSAVHELIEYASTLLLGPEKGMLKINDPDKFDTQKDLLNNLLGTCLALFLSQCARQFQPRKSSSQASPIPSPNAE